MASELIRKKRNGEELNYSEIEHFIRGAVDGSIPDYQVSAFLMAVYFKGMTFDETTSLTKAMIASGKCITLKNTKPKIDKHSTGGVGDKISLIVAPLVASLGVDVPMVAGRGLGHTGGTLDKLESIPGFNVHLKIDEFICAVSSVGSAIMGQTDELVPADKLLYALRDVTATVECIPLITASILSKKVAEGITGLVLDIKVGSGAFMKNLKDAERLARSLIGVGSQLGLKVRALITDMNQPLGFAVGNSLEVIEAIETLESDGPMDVKNLSIEIAAHMLVLGEKSSSLSAARSMAKKALQSKEALKKFQELCKIQGAKQDPVIDRNCLKTGPHQLTIVSNKSGYLAKVHTMNLGLLLTQLGGGRKKTSDLIDHAVGIKLYTKIGAPVSKASPLATVFYKNKPPNLEEKIRSLFIINGQKTTVPKLIKKVIIQ